MLTKIQHTDITTESKHHTINNVHWGTVHITLTLELTLHRNQ